MCLQCFHRHWKAATRFILFVPFIVNHFLETLSKDWYERKDYESN